jgi:hypothetical protein
MVASNAVIAYIYVTVSRGSSGSIVSDYELDARATGVPSPAEARGFLLEHLCPDRLWGPPPIQWILGVLSPAVKRGQRATLTTHLHLVPRSRMSRSYTSSPLSASMACSGTALLYIYVYSHGITSSTKPHSSHGFSANQRTIASLLAIVVVQ